MANFSLVVGRDMSDSIQKILIVGDFRQIVRILIVVNQKRHNSAHEKARIANERSPKSSDSAFSDGLTIFQNCMMLSLLTAYLEHVHHVTVFRGYFLS